VVPGGAARAAPLAAKVLDDIRPGALEVSVRRSRLLHDGRFANNAWLMETPDPVTKITWGNAACLAPEYAAELGLADGDHVRIVVEGREAVLPAFALPGQARRTVTVWAGYGRKAAGRVGSGVGTDAYPLTTTSTWLTRDASVGKAPGHTELATTHNHHAIDEVGRKEVQRRMHELIRQADLEEYRKHPDFAKHAVHHPPLLSLWKEHEYEGRRWGMMIDLSSCTGCSACVVACQSENNVPVVGKDEVLRGREMHWLRVDRYFGGDPADPEVAFQPVPCMQCENAPCEQVCPVAATVHSSEGLNDMVYNRCVGTRYCSNNCPYKVRRFNWFKNHRDLTQVQKMVMNPDVTVRGRGVMEKCTYCVQRISTARITAKNEERPIADGEIVPACAQACPANAIVFGDLADPASRVAKLAKSQRAYGILEELNVKPRTRYLARLKNPME
jgi:molybdopterin-containing oxidoreductase family iron-sulfur binding subunit